MIDILFAGPIPVHIRKKAFFVLEENHIDAGWRKVSGLKKHFSYRLNRNYRIIKGGNENAIVCNHDLYEKKIKGIKRGEIK